MKWRMHYDDQKGIMIYTGKKKNHYIEILQKDGNANCVLEVTAMSGDHKRESYPSLEMAKESGELYALKGIYKRLL